MQMRADRRGPAARALAAGTVLATALALAPAALASVTRTGAVGGGRVALAGSVPGFVRAGAGRRRTSGQRG